MNNLVVITSVINPTDKALSYTNTRSIYSPRERFEQTLKTLKSIAVIPDKEVLFIETSHAENEIEDSIKAIVDHYVNFAHDDRIRQVIDGTHKGAGEATQLWEGLKCMDLGKFGSLFKLSGRYWLNDHFSHEQYNHESNVFLNSPDGASISTVLYKIHRNYFALYLKALEFCKQSEAMLEANFLSFFKDKYQAARRLGVAGYVSVDGCYIDY